MVDVIMSPPAAPFLAASVGMSGADAAYWRMTTSRELIAFGGAASLHDGNNLLLVERQRFVEAVNWFRCGKIGVSDLLRFRDLQNSFQRGVLTGVQARARLEKLNVDLLRGYPGQSNPVIMKLAAWAAGMDQEEVAA
ncbi:MAG: hypothetical protein HC844_14080 [Tabrizicola sp.]|nr:hypothetical protein [Tabrizicola sp.]